MDIIINGAELSEPDVLTAALQHCFLWQTAREITIFVSARVPADAPAYKFPGWLEYLIRVSFTNGAFMTVGCIQRKPGEPIEFHS